MTAARVTPPELSAPAAWKRLAPEIAKLAIDQGLTGELDMPIDLAVTVGADLVGRGQMTVHHEQSTVQ